MPNSKGEERASKKSSKSKTKWRSGTDHQGVELNDVRGTGYRKVAQTFGTCCQGWLIHETLTAGFEAQRQRMLGSRG